MDVIRFDQYHISENGSVGAAVGFRHSLSAAVASERRGRRRRRRRRLDDDDDDAALCRPASQPTRRRAMPRLAMQMMSRLVQSGRQFLIGLDGD